MLSWHSTAIPIWQVRQTFSFRHSKQSIFVIQHHHEVRKVRQQCEGHPDEEIQIQVPVCQQDDKPALLNFKGGGGVVLKWQHIQPWQGNRFHQGVRTVLTIWSTKKHCHEPSKQDQGLRWREFIMKQIRRICQLNK